MSGKAFNTGCAFVPSVLTHNARRCGLVGRLLTRPQQGGADRGGEPDRRRDEADRNNRVHSENNPEDGCRGLATNAATRPITERFRRQKKRRGNAGPKAEKSRYRRSSRLCTRSSTSGARLRVRSCRPRAWRRGRHVAEPSR